MAEKKKPNVALIVVLSIAIIAIAIPTIGYFYYWSQYKAASSSYTESPSFYNRTTSSSSKLTDIQKEMLEEIKLIEPIEVHSESNSSYNIFVGTLQNKSDKTHYFIKVKGEFKDDQGNTIDTDWTYACGDEGLRPGESTKFKLSVDRDERITSINCYTYDYR